MFLLCLDFMLMLSDGPRLKDPAHDVYQILLDVFAMEFMLEANSWVVAGDGVRR